MSRNATPKGSCILAQGEERSDGTLGTAPPFNSTLQGWRNMWVAAYSLTLRRLVGVRRRLSVMRRS